MSLDIGLQQDVARLLETRLKITVPDPATDLIAEGLLDSLGLVELFVALEEQFGAVVDVDDLDFDDLRSVEAISRYVERTRPR